MADLTAHFRADFSDFSTAVQRAEVELKSFEADANKVEGSLTRMADAFSGRKVIQDATLMVEAVERLGGATKLTEAEFARLQRTVTEASAKMIAMGQDVPKAFEAITAGVKQTSTALDHFGVQTVKVGTQSSNAFSTLGQSIGQVDRLAALAGVSIGPLGLALSELGAIATTTSTALATLGPAGLVVAGTFALFKGGELLREYTDLDDSIMKLAEDTFGWGNASKYTQEQIDALQFATLHYGREITDLSVAMDLQKQHARELAKEWEALAAMEETLAERSQDAAKQFTERFRAAAAVRNEVAKAANADYAKLMSDTANLTGQFQMDAAKAAMDQAQASAEANARGLDLMLLDFIKHEEALMAEAEKARQKEAAAAQTFFQTELGGGMKIIGADLAPGMSELARPQSLERPQSLSQRGVTLSGSDEAPPTTYAPTINMSGMLLSDDPGTLDRLRTTINQALTPGMKQGRYYGSR